MDKNVFDCCIWLWSNTMKKMTFLYRDISYRSVLYCLHIVFARQYTRNSNVFVFFCLCCIVGHRGCMQFIQPFIIYSWVVDWIESGHNLSMWSNLEWCVPHRLCTEPNQKQQNPNGVHDWWQNWELQWHHNDCDGISNHRLLQRLLSRLFRQQIKENIKALCHWPLWGEYPGKTRKMFPFEDIMICTYQYAMALLKTRFVE